MYNRMIRVDGQCTQVSCDRAIEYSCFLQHITKIDVRVQEIWIDLDSLNQENMCREWSDEPGEED